MTVSAILKSEVFYSEWFNREVALYSIVQYICTCVYVPTAFTYVHMYIRTCVFMQKEESDTQAACTRPLLRMQTKEGVSSHSEKVNYIH